jgi:hypothetical protein
MVKLEGSTLNPPFMLATCAFTFRAFADGNTASAKCDFTALNLFQQLNGAWE